MVLQREIIIEPAIRLQTKLSVEAYNALTHMAARDGATLQHVISKLVLQEARRRKLPQEAYRKQTPRPGRGRRRITNLRKD